jgi:hypothetical protein
MQSAVDPEAINAGEMAELCLDMLRTYLWAGKPARKKRILQLNGEQ